MNIHEYQAKEMLAAYSIPIPCGRVALTSAQVERAAKELGGHCVVKAQIYAGGRGKAGGVREVYHPEQAHQFGKELFGRTLVTPQTGPEGLRVRRILVEEAVEVAGELYLCITLDRTSSRYCLIACPEGGIDLEEVTQLSPQLILRHQIDPATGLRPHQARRLALRLGLSGGLGEDCVQLMLNMYRLSQEKECTLVEINPLVVTRAGWLVALDARIELDDNALFRHHEYPDLIDYSQQETQEINASKYDLAYVKLGGSIGCIVNGAGLAMATLDLLRELGGEPANFLDVGGGASREKVAEALRIVLEDEEVTGIFVNIFGGTLSCAAIALGIIEAATALCCTLPIVVRLGGSQAEQGKRLLAESQLTIESAETLGDGAARIIALTTRPPQAPAYLPAAPAAT